MDEATPHLHIDFVPFTTKSKRGLDTRVSLKQALSNQGFVGNSKHETEWSLWVESEKEELSKVMERYGIEWEQKGTHEKHLSVYDYEKKMRSEEVEKLTDEAQELNIKVDLLREQVESLTQFEIDIDVIHRNFDEEEEFKLPDPSPLMTAKAYKTKIVEPLFKKIIGIAKTAVLLCIHLQDRVKDRKYYERLAEERTERLRKENRSLSSRNDELNREVQDHKLLRKIFGDEQINTLVSQAKEIEWNNRQARYQKPFRTKATPRQRHKDREER